MLNKTKLEQSNEEMIQKQSAGDNSKQFQVGNVVINQGITEERARSVFAEMIPQALEKYTQEAYETANQRINQLENAIMPRMMKIDGAFASFSDPAFQVMLRRAQQSAASTERSEDYALLSELIVCQVQKGSDRKNRTGISKAIEIVGEIDGDALCGLTVAHAVNKFLPVAGDMRIGLKVLDDLFGELFYINMPTESDWLDHLDILGAIRISKYARLKKLRDYYSEKLNGYVCAGIRIGSTEYEKALEILALTNLDVSLLVPNELASGHVILPVRDKAAIREMVMKDDMNTRLISESEIEALEKIWDLYLQDDTLQKDAKSRFDDIWDSYASLKKLRIWWENLPFAFDITGVGTVLAHTNAKRCDSNLPDLI